MFKAFRDPLSLRLFSGAAVILCALIFIGIRMARYDVPMEHLAGTYDRAPIAFLQTENLPQKVILHEDGTIRMFSAEGGDLFSGKWTWDRAERMAKINDPLWDRRIRVRSSLTGPMLCMRVSGLPLELDHHEHDEEVDFVRKDLADDARGD